MYWRRWALLASACADLLLLVFTMSGVRFSYAQTAVNHSSDPLVGQIVRVVFWLLLVAAILANALAALGWQRARYHLLLNVALVGMFYCEGLLGIALIVYSLAVVHGGYFEPLILWQLMVYQFLVLMSAHDADAPQPLHLPPPLRLQLVRLLTSHPAQRLAHAGQAFWQTLNHGPSTPTGPIPPSSPD